MRIFKNKAFNRWTKEVGLMDNELKEAVKEINDGLYEANLGGNVFKKRIALEGRGKSSGARTIVAFRSDKHTFFVYGYAKNVRSNISEQETSALKKLAKLYFSFNDEKLAQAIHAGELIEVN
jgi:hypothetical protein